jgi:hypothetical protein
MLGQEGYALVLKDQAEETRAGFAAATKGQSGGELRTVRVVSCLGRAFGPNAPSPPSKGSRSDLRRAGLFFCL